MKEINEQNLENISGGVTVGGADLVAARICKQCDHYANCGERERGLTKYFEQHGFWGVSSAAQCPFYNKS